MLGITGYRLERLGHSLKQQAVHHARILQGEGTQLGREGKDDMTVGHVQEFPLAGCEPGRLRASLTLRAVAIPAGIITDLLVATVITLGFVPAEDRRAALRDGLEYPPLCRLRHRAIAGEVACPILADHIGDFQWRAGHGWPSWAGGSGKVSRGLGMMDRAWGVTWR